MACKSKMEREDEREELIHQLKKFKNQVEELGKFSFEIMTQHQKYYRNLHCHKYLVTKIIDSQNHNGP